VGSYVQDTPFLQVLSSGEYWGYWGATSGVNWAALPAVALGLLLFGVVFNLAISYLHRHGLNEGYVWLEVVIGVAVTLAAASFVVPLTVVAALFVLFAAAGLAPALGDIWRYVRARRAEAGKR
jgi:hypothetical protein